MSNSTCHDSWRPGRASAGSPSAGSPSDRFRQLAGTGLLLGLLASLACGGGSEPTAPNPTGTGSGMATVLLDGLDLGRTALVSGGIADALAIISDATDEMVVFTSDVVALANRPLTPDPATATGAGGTPSYVEGPQGSGAGDYELNRPVGAITRQAGGDIPGGGTIFISYRYLEDLLTLQVGVTLEAGTLLEVDIFNVRRSGSAPITVHEVASSPPAGEARGFNVVVNTNLVQFVGRETLIAVDDCSVAAGPDCPVRNTLSVQGLDLSNPISPCIDGRVLATMRPTTTADPAARVVLDLSFATPGCF